MYVSDTPMVLGEPVEGSLNPKMGHNQIIENHWLRKSDLFSGENTFFVSLFFLVVNVQCFLFILVDIYLWNGMN